MNLKKLPEKVAVEKVEKERALKVSSFLQGEGDVPRLEAAVKFWEELLGVELDDKAGDRWIETMKLYCEFHHLKDKAGNEVLSGGKPLADLAFWPTWTASAAMGALYKRPEQVSAHLYTFASALNTVARQAAFKALWDKAAKKGGRK